MGIIVVAGLSAAVGKTTATAAIAHILHSAQLPVIAGKLTRFDGDHDDLATIKRLAGVPVEDFAIAPDPIARIEELANQGNTVVIEGSGGISEPLLGYLTIADVAAKLDAHLFLVTGTAKGATNLAAQAGRFANICGVKIAGVIGGALPPNAGLQTRLRLMEVARETKAPFWGTMPEGMDTLSPTEFAQATEHMMGAKRWQQFIAQYA